ncbi:hypothetical protein AAIH70_30105 [Neorhizobium sp. BT27B]|uniref:hypothetical protein n=1 Tax=Neorhizobium sp. BT27B TaxID=3142625 RepID=UPI003D2A7415
MQNIQDWLRSEVADVVSQGQQGGSKSDLEDQARRIWQTGIAAGYTNEDIKAACGATWNPIC